MLSMVKIHQWCIVWILNIYCNSLIVRMCMYLLQHVFKKHFFNQFKNLFEFHDTENFFPKYYMYSKVS